jgi:hypothetical integral membrane protein (TIGR02206 family)
MILAQWAPLAVTVVAAATAVVALRGRSPGRTLGSVILVALLGSELTVLLWPVEVHTWSAATTLPLQLSDVATLVAVVSLAAPRLRWVRELTYLWSVPAGLLGLAFPAIGASAPSPLFYAFYVDHGTLLFYGALLGFDRSLQLTVGSALRAMMATVLWGLIAGFANLATGGDYMFVRRPPPTWSPLLLMGPWPWYVFSAAGVAAITFMGLTWPKLDRGPSHS